MLKVFLKFSFLLVIVTFIVVLGRNYFSKKQFEKLDIQVVSLEKTNDILPLDNQIVTPVVYSNIVSLKDLPSEERKKKFIELVLPSVLIAQHRIKQDAHLVEWLQKHPDEMDTLVLNYFKKNYGTKDLAKLKVRVKAHPSSIVLAQAAIESGWGTSNFFMEANNIFGIWANENTLNKVEANITRNGKPVYLRKYSSLYSSVRDYYLTIARVRAYEKFRQERYKSNEPLKMIKFLNKYSELGKIYPRRIRRVIKENNLTQYDSYSLDPEFITKIGKEDLLFTED
jgi:Bax protein